MFFNICGQVIIGWLIADFLSGLFHWWQDRWPSSTVRWIGPFLIAHSRLHHKQPSAFGDNSFVYRNLTTFIGAGVTALPLVWMFGLSPLLISLTIGGALTTQIHYLCHFPLRVNRLGKILQSSGIIQSPSQHSRHHRQPNDTHYCVLTNFVNPILDDLKVWTRLERLIIRLGLKMSLGEN